MIGRALGEGVRSATRRPGLVALLWAWNLALAAAAALPLWSWVYSVSSVSPQTDVLLDGVNVGLVTQLIAAQPGAMAPIMAAAAGLAALSLLSGAFLSGGILEVVMGAGDARPLLHRFFRGAGHFLGRFVRLLLVAVVTALPVLAVVGAVLGAADSGLEQLGSEAISFWAGIAVQAGVALTLAFFMLALDYARVMTVLSGSRGMIRTWLRAMLFVARRTPGVAAIGLLAGVAVVLALLAAVAFDVAYSARGWTVILGAVLVHQAVAFFRTAVRVGQVSAQARYCAGLWAAPVPRPAVPSATVPMSAPAPAGDVATEVGQERSDSTAISGDGRADTE